MAHDLAQTDELTGGSTVWVNDADIAGGTEPGRRALLDSLPENTRKLDLQMLESLRSQAEHPPGAHAAHPSSDATEVRYDFAAHPSSDATEVRYDFAAHPSSDATEVRYDFAAHPSSDATQLMPVYTPRLAAPLRLPQPPQPPETQDPNARRGPPPPVQPAQWFDDLDLAAEAAPDTSPNRPLPWLDANPPRARARVEPVVRSGAPPMRRRLLAQDEVAIVDMAYRYPGWGMVRVTNALRREGVDVNVKEVSEVLSRYGVWSPLGRAALQKERSGRTLHRTVRRRLLIGFEVLAFATLTLAVAVAWLSI